MNPTAPISADLAELARLTLALQQQTSAATDDSSEADAIRDRMEEPWSRLSALEMELADGLSADLYSLSDEEFPPVDKSERILGEEELKRAWDSHDWPSVLTLVRYGPAFLTRDQIACIRGICWLELGQPEVALAFLELASKITPGNVDYRIMVAHVAAQIGDAEKTEQLISGIDDLGSMTGPLQKLQLAGALFALADRLTDDRAIDVENRVVQLIDEAFRAGDLAAKIAASTAARYWLMLGICQLDLDNPRDAEFALRKVLQLQPWNRQAQLLLDQQLSSSAEPTRASTRPSRKNLRGFGLLSNGPFERIVPNSLFAIGPQSTLTST